MHDPVGARHRLRPKPLSGVLVDVGIGPRSAPAVVGDRCLQRAVDVVEPGPPLAETFAVVRVIGPGGAPRPGDHQLAYFEDFRADGLDYALEGLARRCFRSAARVSAPGPGQEFADVADALHARPAGDALMSEPMPFTFPQPRRRHNLRCFAEVLVIPAQTPTRESFAGLENTSRSVPLRALVLRR